jgi:hypothetical protein
VQVVVEVIEGFVLKRKEEGSSELRRSSVLCEEGFLGGSVLVTIEEIIKKKSWWM